MTTIKQQPIQPIPYQQDLDAGLPTSQLHKSQVRYWSDFNRVFFHPRSIVQLNEYSLNSSIAPFENWNAGEELFRDVDREADLLDRDVRPFVEECDSMQGFQVFAGADDAWGGWTSRYIDVLMDEYGKKSTWVYGLEDTRQIQREKMIARKANAARTLSEVSKLASVYTMLGTRPSNLPKYLDCDFNSEWEMSAIMAAAVESATLSTRLRDTIGDTQRSTMPEYEQFLSSDEGRNIWELGLSVNEEGDSVRLNGEGNGNGNGNANADTRAPQHDPRLDNAQTAEDLAVDQEPTTPDIIFTPTSSHLLRNTTATRQAQSFSPSTHTFTQVTTSRHSKHPNSSNYPQPQPPLTQETLLRLRYADLPIVKTYQIPILFPLLDAYPSSLFSSRRSDSDTSSTPLTASLTTSTTQKHDLISLRDLVTRENRAIGMDEREELYDSLTAVAERYTFGVEGEGDDDWGSGEE